MSTFNEKYYPDEAAWLRARKIGGSTISAIMGRNRYYSRWQAWKDLTGKGSFEETYTTKRGHALEPIVADEVMNKLGKRFYPCTRTIYSNPERPWETCTPDYVNRDEMIGMEIKNSSSRMRHIYDGEGPLDSQVDQCQWCLKITGWHTWLLVIAIEDEEPRIIPITRDEEWMRQAEATAEDFWNTHVLGEVPPPADDSEEYTNDLLVKHPHGDGVVTLTDEDDGEEEVRLLIGTYHGIGVAIKDLEKRKRENGNRIREIIGDNRKVVTSGGYATWYDMDRGPSWKKVAETLAKVVDPQLYEQALAAAQNNTKTRVLRVTYKKGPQ